MQTNGTDVFFGMSCLRTAHSLRGGTGVLRRFSRFVTVGLGMFACLHVIFQTCMKQPYLRFCGMCFISTKFKQTAVDVKHGSLVKHCS